MIEAFKEALSLPLGEYEVAHLAHAVERVDASMPGGKQDQYAATFGGSNFMEFYADNRVIVNPLRIAVDRERVGGVRLVLFNTGVSRDSEAIIAEQIRGIANQDHAVHR